MTFDNRPFSPTNAIDFNGVKVPYFNDDNPAMAYVYHGLCFVAQPLYGPEINKAKKIITVPLMMTDEWDIITNNSDEMLKWRGRDKTFDFNFIGQTGYAGRHVFKSLVSTMPTQQYLFKETRPIYDLEPEEKKQELLHFLDVLSHCRFTFAPRGVGSSSFRAYQAMMVGSVPIITGMNDYPFDDEVDWDTFCLRGDLDELPELIEKAKWMDDLEWIQMSEAAKEFWDNYCRHDSLYTKLKEIAMRH